MRREYCDICGRMLNSLIDSESMANRFWRTYGFNYDKPQFENSLTLCEKCNERMIAYISNRYDLRNDIDSMRLGNRIRFLLKLPFKVKKETQHE